MPNFLKMPNFLEDGKLPRIWQTFRKIWLRISYNFPLQMGQPHALMWWDHHISLPDLIVKVNEGKLYNLKSMFKRQNIKKLRLFLSAISDEINHFFKVWRPFFLEVIPTTYVMSIIKKKFIPVISRQRIKCSTHVLCINLAPFPSKADDHYCHHIARALCDSSK